MKILVLETVNPVFRRRRLAKVMAKARDHWKQKDSWEKIYATLDAKGRKISKPFIKTHGSDFRKWPDAAKKAHSAAHDKHIARLGNAEDQVYRNLHRGQKAWAIAKGRKDLPDGSTSFRPRPSNPLRKNRDERSGKHQMTAARMKEFRAANKRNKPEWAKKTEGLVKNIKKFIKVS